MKGFILAAGFGTRLGNATRDLPKPLLPIGSHRLIDWPVQSLQNAGISEIVVNLHYHGDQIRRYLVDGFPDIHFIFSVEETILGTGGGIAFAKEHLQDETFVIFNADVISDIGIRGLVAHHRSSGAAATMVTVTDSSSKSGEVRIDASGRVRQISGRPPSAGHFQPRVFAGIHVVEPSIFDYVQPRFSSVITDFYLPMMTEGKPVSAFDHNGYWCDAGSPETYKRIIRDDLKLVESLL